MKSEKKFLGMPMRWDLKNIGKDIWNPKDDRVFPPKHFGIGWGLNLHAVIKKLKRKNMTEKSDF